MLLRRVVEAFPNHFDFLDGDITFRKQHLAMDFFVDEINDLSPLLPPGSPDRRRLDLLEGGDGDSPVVPFATTSNTFKGVASQETSSRAARSVVKKRKKGGGGTKKKVNVEEEEEEEEDYTSSTVASMVNGKLQYPWELRGRRVIPDPYDFRTVDRAPIVSICGYTAYRRDSQTYFSGNRVGGAFIDRKTFFKHWRKVKDKIDTPFIAVCALNENWGFVSSNFPNRTAGWGQCCNVMPRDKEVWDFLNHPKTLALVINQHSNISHPKVLTYIHTYTPTHLHTPTHTHTYTHIHTHTHTYTHIHTPTHTYTHSHTHTLTHSHIHIHIHTDVDSPSRSAYHVG